VPRIRGVITVADFCVALATVHGPCYHHIGVSVDSAGKNGSR